MNEKMLRLCELTGKNETEIIQELVSRELHNIGFGCASLPERLRYLRKLRNASQQDVADATGLGLSSIGNYEKGSREPKASCIVKFATFFKCSTDFLLGLKSSKEEFASNENVD